MQLPELVLLVCSSLFSSLAMIFCAIMLRRQKRDRELSALVPMVKEIRNRLSQQDEARRIAATGKSRLLDLESENARLLKELNQLRQMNPATVRPSVHMSSAPQVAERQVSVSNKTFVEEIIEVYNSAEERNLGVRFNPQSAELEGTTQLRPHDAGSFWIVRSPLGEGYCLPRPRRITPTLHEHVGLRHLFEYPGYNPDGPDVGFRLDKPASVAFTDGCWTLKKPGSLTVIVEGKRSE